ncbi:MAG: hypothetical protein JWO38_6607 [Gemmataceae bacterium]|nr:hypothetical protein [Gemmataceae bacterium]
MNVGQLRTALETAPDTGLHLMLPDGDLVPAHFHVTEVGRVHKDFIDCGGTTRSTTACVLQVWVAGDLGHRITTTKLAGILRLAEPLVGSGELPVEVEYEGAVVSQYPVAAAEITPAGVLLHLGSKHTDCLAPDLCGLGTADSACGPGSGCC